MSALTKIQSFNNKEFYYGDYWGDDRSWVLALKNLFFPEKFIDRVRYNQIVPLPWSLTKAEPLAPHLETPEVLEAVKTLKRDGVLILPAYAPDTAKYVAEEYNAKPRPEILAAKPDITFNVDSTHPLILKFLTDEFLLSVVGKYYGAQPFLRMLPDVNRCYPDGTREELMEKYRAGYKPAFNTDWHFDTVNLVNIHLILNDISHEDTHMLYAKKSHKKLHINLEHRDAVFSDKNVESKYELAHCNGPIGTVYVFDTNGIHRMEPKAKSFRGLFGQMITPGNNSIETGTLRLSPQELASLKPLQRRYLRHVTTP